MGGRIRRSRLGLLALVIIHGLAKVTDHFPQHATEFADTRWSEDEQSDKVLRQSEESDVKSALVVGLLPVPVGERVLEAGAFATPRNSPYKGFQSSKSWFQAGRICVSLAELAHKRHTKRWSPTPWLLSERAYSMASLSVID